MGRARAGTIGEAFAIMIAIVKGTMPQVVSCAVAVLALAWSGARALAGDDAGWMDLIGDHGLDAWRTPAAAWLVAGDAGIDPKHTNRLAPKPGAGTLMNGATGKTQNLLSRQDFQDVEAHFEFLIPKGSNSGVKFEGLYEIQIADSFGVAKPTASHSGGIYPRAEMLPRYHHIDDGVPPRLNAARAAGEWQTLDVIFRAPRFDSQGKKTRSARFDKVVLNGQVIHDGVDVKTPTGHAWRLKEVARGPILLQGDHGPVAFRNIRVKRLEQ
jgi:hypothetical protein